MDSLEPRNRGERWVLYVSKKAQGKWWPLVWLLLGISIGLLCVWGIVLNKNIYSSFFETKLLPDAAKLLLFDMVSIALLGFCTAMSLFTAILYFERRHFYLIIQRLKEKIDSLDKQRPTIHKNTKE